MTRTRTSGGSLPCAGAAVMAFARRRRGDTSAGRGAAAAGVASWLWRLAGPRLGIRAAVLLAGIACLVPGAAAGEPEALEARRAELEAMTPWQKEELRNNKQRFDRLPAEEQDRLRRLHQALQQDPEADKLHHVMLRYHDWLRSLPPERRADLARLPQDQRLEEIKTQMEHQERQRFREMVGRLHPDDVGVIKDWLSGLVKRDLRSSVHDLPPEDRQRLLAKDDPWDILDEIARRDRKQSREQRTRALELVTITQADIQQLQTQLSKDAKQMLNEARDPEAKLAAVRDWLGVLSFTRRFPRVSDEDLQRYLRERVDARTRDYLENLPREQMIQRLRWMYFADRYRPRGWDGGPRPHGRWGPPDFRPPDFREPPEGPPRGDRPEPPRPEPTAPPERPE